MMTILWARHGENVANLTRTFSYRVFDGDLTSRGQRQARELAGRLATDGEPVTYLACSPLRRARQTAQIVARRLGLTVAAELDGLRELNVGTLDGRSDTQAWETYTQVLTAWKAGQAQTVRTGAGHGQGRQPAANRWRSRSAHARHRGRGTRTDPLLAGRASIGPAGA